MNKKIIALLLCLITAFSCFTICASAADLTESSVVKDDTGWFATIFRQLNNSFAESNLFSKIFSVKVTDVSANFANVFLFENSAPYSCEGNIKVTISPSTAKNQGFSLKFYIAKDSNSKKRDQALEEVAFLPPCPEGRTQYECFVVVSTDDGGYKAGDWVAVHKYSNTGTITYNVDSQFGYMRDAKNNIVQTLSKSSSSLTSSVTANPGYFFLGWSTVPQSAAYGENDSNVAGALNEAFNKDNFFFGGEEMPYSKISLYGVFVKEKYGTNNLRQPLMYVTKTGGSIITHIRGDAVSTSDLFDPKGLVINSENYTSLRIINTDSVYLYDTPILTNWGRLNFKNIFAFGSSFTNSEVFSDVSSNLELTEMHYSVYNSVLYTYCKVKKDNQTVAVHLLTRFPALNTEKETFFVPEKISNSSVIAIEDEAFVNCKKLKEVSLEGTSVVSIGSSSFIGCSSLKKINIGTCLEIGPYAFDGCPSDLTYVVSALNKGYTVSSDGHTLIKK